MLNQATMDMLTSMKMTAMAAEFANQLKDPRSMNWALRSALGLLVKCGMEPTPEQQTEPVYPQRTLRRAVCHRGRH